MCLLNYNAVVVSWDPHCFHAMQMLKKYTISSDNLFTHLKDISPLTSA